jgi:hypothetical protein
MSAYTIQQYCQSIWSVQAQVTVMRDAIESDKTNFSGDDRTFLDSIENSMNTYLLAVTGPLNDCIDRHTIMNEMSVNPPAFGGEGCKASE